MRLLVLSDLHLEIWGERAPCIDASSKPDVVVLAGDIHSKARGPAWAAESFPGVPVLYVAGNHEFYGDTIDKLGPRIRNACETYDNVHYLDCGEFTLPGVRFLGLTLWTDLELFGPARKHLAIIKCKDVMNDYHLIKFLSNGSNEYRKLHPIDTERLHAEQRRWLERKLEVPFAGKTVVISHMAPSMLSIPPIYASDIVSAAYASNLDDLVAKADLWIHGHTHTSHDYEVGRCRIVTNPLGYPTRQGLPENPQFDQNFIVHLGTAVADA